MFKKGQVWRSKRTGILYVCDSCVKGYPPLFKRIGGGVLAKPMGHRQLTLIGNNYQERPTTKAEKPAMKPSHTLKLVLRGGSLRPDGRFWYSETTIKQIAAEAGIEVQS